MTTNGTNGGDELVTTTRGDMLRSMLVMSMSETDTGDCIIVAREWVADDGEIVRRDVWVTVKRTPAIGAAQASMS